MYTSMYCRYLFVILQTTLCEEWPEAQKEAARQLGNEQKWILVCQLREKQASQSESPKEVIAKLQDSFSLSRIEHLVIYLTREPVTWAREFIKNDGVKLLVNIMNTLMEKEKYV